LSAESDEYVQIARQFGVFVRRAERFLASFPHRSEQSSLGRDAYLLLGSSASTDRDGCRGGRGTPAGLSTVSRQVAALEAAGLVSRTGDPTDHRAHSSG